MTETTVDSLPVAQLPDRYSIARSVLYTRLSDLKIRPEKRGNRAYVNADQLKLLDAAHAAIQAGVPMAEFLVSRGLFESGTGQSVGQSELTISPLASVDPSAAIAALDALVGGLMSQANPLANLELLEKACSHGWWLSTSQLAALLGLKSLNGREIHRYGFTFTRVGKNGSESAWAITKIRSNPESYEAL